MQGSDISRGRKHGRPKALNIPRTRVENRRALTAVQPPGTQAQLESVFRAAPIGICLLSSRVILEVNHRFCEMTGYSREELVGHSSRMLYMTQGDYDYVGTVHYGQIAQTGTGSVETRWKCKDGQVIDVLLSTSAIDREDLSKGVTVTATDITERKRSQNELRESESRFRELFNHMSSGVAVYEAVNDGQDFVLKDFNQAAQRIDSAPRASVLGRKVTDAFPGVKEFGLLDVLRRVWRTGRPEHHPAKIYRDNRVLGWRENNVYKLPGGEVVAVYDDVTDRERGAEALRQSEEKYRALVEGSLVGIGISKGNQILYANQSLLRMYGYDDFREFAAKSLLEYLTPESRDFVQHWRQCQERGQEVPRVFEVDIVRKDGAVRTLQACISYIATGDALCAQTAFIDITERKQIEKRLAESEEKFKILADESFDSIVIHDGRRLIGVNETFCRTWGYTAEEVIGSKVERYVMRESLSIIRENMANNYGKPYEIVAIRKDGTRFPAEVVGKPLVYRGKTVRISTVRDISSTRQAEKALRESEQRFRSLFENNLDAVLLTTPDGSILAANPAASAMFGRTEEELRQGGRSAIVDEADPRLPVALEERARTGRFVGDLTCLRRDGTKFPVEVASTVFKDKDGRLRTSMVIRDVTERRKAEENLLAQQRKLRSLASELSLAEERERRRIAVELHDHACQSLALARMSLQSQIEAARPLKPVLRQACCALDETMSGLRNLTFDLSSATLYRFGLEAAVEELLADKLARPTSIAYRFTTDHEPKPLPPETSVLLFRCVRELLINVIKHARAKNVTVEMQRADRSIEILVADDGVGFDADAILSSACRNHSVGLFFVREHLDYAGGALRIDSRLGGGSRFILTAPLDKGAESVKEDNHGREDSAGG